MEIANVFANVSKEKFRNASCKLLNECFLLKKHKDTTAEYFYVINNKDAFVEYFGILGYELTIDEQYGVIGLNNTTGTGRIHLSKIESILLLILRLLYIEKRRELSQSEDVIIISDEIYDKYNMLKLKRLNKSVMRQALGKFQGYHLLGRLDPDVANPSTRIIIYPSIFLAITVSSLEDMYNVAKEKLEKYESGGDVYDSDENTDSEMVDED